MFFCSKSLQKSSDGRVVGERRKGGKERFRVRGQGKRGVAVGSGREGITEGEQRANAFKRVVGVDPQHLNAENRQQQGVPALDVHRGRVREGQEFANASGLSSGRGMHQGGALQHPASGIDRVFEKGQQQLDDVGVAANRGLNQGREPPGVWFKKIQQALARVQQELNAFRVAAVDGQCQRAIWR